MPNVPDAELSATRPLASKRKNGNAPVCDPRDPLRSARALADARFTDADGFRLMHRHRGMFWRFRSNCYRPSEDEATRSEIWKFLEIAVRVDESGRLVPFRPTRARVADVFEALCAVCELDQHIDPPAWFGGQGIRSPAFQYLPVANGLLHLPTGRLSPPTPELFVTSASAVTFDQTMPIPRLFMSFLTDIFGEDEQSKQALQEFFGYSLSASTALQKILLLVGPTRAGKGVLARVLKEIVGFDSCVAPTLASLSANFGLAPLIGKSLAIISDARIGGRADQAAITERLLAVSGEDTVTIDRKHRSAWTGRLALKIAIMTNELPRLADASGALAKRFLVVVLRNSFYGREDPKLTDKLLLELPGILNWSLEGYNRLRKREHFVQPESSQASIDAIEALGSPVTSFVRSQCEIGVGFQVAVDVLWMAWVGWCANEGRREHGVKEMFGRDLIAAFPSIRKVRPREGEQRYAAYQGIALTV